jgi:hypothetical protein
LAPPSRDGRTGGIEDADAVTQEIPVPHTLGVERPRQPIARAGSRGRRTGGGAPIAAALLLLVLAALVVAALALALGNLGGLAVRSPSIAATPSASPAAPSPSSPAPSPSPPSPSPSPPPSTPPPTPTPDPVAEVAAARDDLEAVVDGLRDQGLRDRDADEIVRNADDVVAAVEAGDEDRARQRLGRIQDRVDRAANDLDADAAASLREAADRLEAAVNAAFA